MQKRIDSQSVSEAKESLGRVMLDVALSVEVPPGIADMNESEASNLSFIVSHRFGRNADWRFLTDREESEVSMPDLAERVSKRMEELSLRLADEKYRAELGAERLWTGL